MIKQTRGALTMLLSVYRSVLKNAYLKNFAAVALAASVGVASAAEAPSVAESLKLQDTPIELTTGAAITAGTGNDGGANAASATVNDISIGNGDGENPAVLSIKANDSTNGTATLIVNEGKTLTIKNGGKVSLTGDTRDASPSLIPNPAAIGGKIVLDAGDDVDASASVLEFASGRTAVEDVNVKNGTLTITDGTASAKNITSDDKGKITVASAATMIVEKDLNLEDNATLSNDGSILTVGTATIGKLADSAKLGLLTFEGKANFTQTDKLTIGTGDILSIGSESIRSESIRSDAEFAGNVDNTGSIQLFDTSSLTVNGAEGLNNTSSLRVHEGADATVTLKGKLANASTGTITVEAAGEGKVTKATFAGDVENAGTIELQNGSDVTFAGALTNSKTVTSNGTLTVEGKLTNKAGEDAEASTSTINLTNANLGEVDNTKGQITVYSKGNATFGKLNNASASSVTVAAGENANNKTVKTVASFADVVNEGAITLGADSDVSFKNLENKGTLVSSTVLDLVDKLVNTGTVKVSAGTLNASLKNLGIGVAGAENVKVVNTATLDLGDKVELADNIFTDAEEGAAKKIKNTGTIKAGTLTLNDTAEKSADTILENSGKISVATLNLNKGLNSAEKLTVTKAVSTKDTTATLGSSSGINLSNEGKVGGTVTGFNSVVAKIAGLWDLGKANLGAATIDNATVTNVGDIDGATIGSTKKATVTANTVKAATIGNGSTVTATTVNAAKLSGESVLNADKVEATAASDAPITLDKSTLNVGNVEVSGSDEHAGISATSSTVKITGTYKSTATSLVANLVKSTLELNATKNLSGPESGPAIENFRGDENSTLVINGVSGPVKLSTNDKLGSALSDGEVGTLAGVYKQIGINSTNFKGQIKGLNYNTEGVVENGKVALGGLSNYSTIASSTDAFATAQVTAAGAVDQVLNVGSLEIDSGAASNINKDVTLNKAAANGNFISIKDKTGEAAIAGAAIAEDKTLTLNGDGTIGAITAGTNQKGTLVANGNKISAGDIGATSATLGTLEVKSGELTAKAVYADTAKVEGNLVADSLNAATATINGGLTLKKDANVATSGILTAPTLATGPNSNVIVDKIVAAASANLSGSVSASDIKTPTLTIGAAAESGVVTVGKLSNPATSVTVDNGSLKVTEDASGVTLAVNKAGSATFGKSLTLADAASTINGQLKVAGTLTTAESNKLNVGSVTGNATGSVYADTLLGKGGIFIDPEFGQRASGVASMHLDSATNVGFETTTQDIVVGKNAFVAVGVSSEEQARSVLSSLGLTDANGSFKKNGVENAIYTDALVKLGTGKGLTVDSRAISSTTASAGVITLGDKSAVVIGKNAAAKSVQTGKAVLTADINGVGVVLANPTDKAKVIFAGNATKQDIKDVKVFGNANNGGTVISAADADKVSVQLSPLYNEAKLTVDGGITDITVNRGYINTALYNASLPVKNLVAEVADTALTGDGVGSDFIMENALVDGGANIESAARLATFGGAYQAAAAAVNTGIDAAQARLGLGIDNSAEVKGEDISVWANAVYKNTESDSFEAQGANYGADLDLTSLVIGADYNMAEGSKVGAYATFGTGDVDGKGAGHNVKNDVDTYGFGIYGSAKLASGVSILSDVGYTVAQNEFKGIVNADADMKVFTAGANVKYTFNTQVADISPFVGARYTSFNLESYAVKSAKGIVAYTDADTAHIFSIPVGFDLSKQITAGEWNVKPAFTAKVTFNTGDKTVSSSTQFTGVKNTLNLDAEVMDDVTYSVGASVSAAKGAATFGAGLSYTGSSETNELSAQIGARYTF